MFPVFVSIRTPEQLKAVYDLLGDGSADAPANQAATAAATPPKTPKAPKVEKVAVPAAAAQTPPPAAAAVTALSAAGTAFLQGKLAGPVTELSMKDEPKMKAIVAEYGVERVSLIPEAKFPEVLEKVLEALDPGAAERKRLESLDETKGAAPAKRSLL